MTNDDTLNEIGKSKWNTIISLKRWKRVNHAIRHDDKLHYRITERKLEDKRGRKRLKTIFMKKVIIVKVFKVMTG